MLHLFLYICSNGKTFASSQIRTLNSRPSETSVLVCLSVMKSVSVHPELVEWTG